MSCILVDSLNVKSIISIYNYVIYRWWNKPVSVLELLTPVTVQSDVSCGDAIKTLGAGQLDQVPVVNDDGYICIPLFIFIINGP